MKKLAISMALVLTASIMMSTVTSAAMLKPKNAAKSAPKSSASEKSGGEKSEAGTDAKSKEKTNVLLASNSDKTMTIIVPKVSAVKKEKIKVNSPLNNGTVTVDATIYEVESGATIATKSKGKKSTCAVAIYMYDEKSQTYVLYPEPAVEKIGSTTLIEFEGVAVLYQFGIIDPDAPKEFCMTLGTNTFVKVLPAK